jgi:ankyrin repeat protein
MDENFIKLRNEMSACALNGKDADRFIELYNSFEQLRTARPWLNSAASGGNTRIIQFLLQLKCDVNERSRGSIKQPALAAACSEAKVDATALLLKEGASVTVDDIVDNALFSAIHARSLDCVKLLVDAGIDIHKVYDLGHRHKNALAFAEEEGCTDIAKFLREHGAVLPPAK